MDGLHVIEDSDGGRVSLRTRDGVPGPSAVEHMRNDRERGRASPRSGAQDIFWHRATTARTNSAQTRAKVVRPSGDGEVAMAKR